ncbi:ATPase [Frankia sp. Hr75.2]|nr:ATPase [Frankia sp. Hr75.2]
MPETDPNTPDPPTSPTSDERVQIVSFGFLHAPPPPAHLTADLRAHFRDPHLNPALRDRTADDPQVRDTVLRTPGILALIAATTDAVHAFLSGPAGGPVTVAVGCAGGRHRAATVAHELGHRLGVPVSHRDLGKPVVHR